MGALQRGGVKRNAVPFYAGQNGTPFHSARDKTERRSIPRGAKRNAVPFHAGQNGTPFHSTRAKLDTIIGPSEGPGKMRPWGAGILTPAALPKQTFTPGWSEARASFNPLVSVGPNKVPAGLARVKDPVAMR